MPGYKDYSYDQHKFIPVFLQQQILPGTFEYTLNYLIDHEVELSVFEARYRNDETGAPTYDRGFCHSLRLCCRENTILMALSADTQPHFSTIAGFICSMSEQIPVVFRDVLLVCDEMGLIGRQAALERLERVEWDPSRV